MKGMWISQARRSAVGLLAHRSESSCASCSLLYPVASFAPPPSLQASSALHPLTPSVPALTSWNPCHVHTTVQGSFMTEGQRVSC